MVGDYFSDIPRLFLVGGAQWPDTPILSMF